MPTMPKEYIKKYIANKHAESIICELCGGCYKLYFKKVHHQSIKHNKAIEKNKQDQLMLEEKEIKKLKDKNIKLTSQVKALQQQLKNNENNVKAKLIEDPIVKI